MERTIGRPIGEEKKESGHQAPNPVSINKAIPKVNWIPIVAIKARFIFLPFMLQKVPNDSILQKALPIQIRVKTSRKYYRFYNTFYHKENSIVYDRIFARILPEILNIKLQIDYRFRTDNLYSSIYTLDGISKPVVSATRR